MERINLKKEEQLDQQIADKKWKPALKLVETRQKKGDKSDALLVRKIIIFFSFTDGSRLQQGINELTALEQRKPPITDHQALKRLDLFLAGRKDRDDFANKIWATAGATSKDEEFFTSWFQLKLDQERWEAAQKAAQTWQKAFPQKRAPFFLWILSAHLVSIAAGVPHMSRQLANNFAYKLLAKAVTDVPDRESTQGNTPSPIRAIKTEQDLLLLLEVYSAQRKFLEALAILEDPRTGYMSHLPRNKWEIARRMIGLYALCEKWKDQWDMCSAILIHARPGMFDQVDDHSAKYNFGELGDDWAAWNGLVLACEKLAAGLDETITSHYVVQTETIIEKFCKGHRSRNAMLANVKLHSIRAATDVDHIKQLVSICGTYFSKYCHKVTCFQDLRPYMRYLDQEHQADLLHLIRCYALEKGPAADADDAVRLHWIIAEQNVLKFEYYFVISRDDNSQLHECLPAFICSCLQIYRLSLGFAFKLPPSDRLPGDDAAILAAMALIRMDMLRHQNSAWADSLIQCVALLEFALDKSKHNYDILIILVRVYMHLGAGSLAIARYSQLSAKNLQHLTISWMLFTRLSTVHPYPASVTGFDGQKMTIDPLQETLDALNWHRRARQLYLHSMDGFRANGQWMMELDALEINSALQNGFSRLLLIQETSRMQRFRHLESKIDDGALKPARLSQSTKDTRDHAAFPDYEADGQLEFWQICPSVESAGRVVTNEKWLASNLRQALIWDSLSGEESSVIERTDLESFSRSYGNQGEANTDVEETLFAICDLIQKSLDQLRPIPDNQGFPHTIVGQILLQVQKINKGGTDHAFCYSKAGAHQNSYGTDLHTKYCLLEMCQFVDKFAAMLQKLDRPEPWLKRMPQDLKAAVGTIASGVWRAAAANRTNISAPTFPGNVHQRMSGSDKVGGELTRLLIDQVSLKKTIKLLQESWVDAYEGVIRTKVVG